MESLLHDLRFGIRVLLKSPGFTAIAVITLALGIGANCAIFSVVNTMLIRSLPFREPDQLMWAWDARPQLEQAPASYPEFVDWRDMNQVLDQMAAGRGTNFDLTGMGDPERLPGSNATANSFEMAPGVRGQVSGVGMLEPGILELLSSTSEGRNQKSEDGSLREQVRGRRGQKPFSCFLHPGPWHPTPGT